MPASVSVKQRTGASGSPTDTSITNLQFTAADAANNGSNNPIQASQSVNINSYVAAIFLNADTTPTTNINNIRAYTSGSNPWSGVNLNVATGSTYTQATGSAGNGTTLNTSNFSGISAPVNAFTLTQAVPLAVNGSIANPNTGKISDFIYLQLVVTPTVAQGALAQGNFFIDRDEF